MSSGEVACDKILGALRRMNDDAGWGRIPIGILDKIGYDTNWHSGIDVTLGVCDGKFVFLYTMSVPYERPDDYSFSVDDQLLSRYFEEE
jgi:hypothetical protein